MNEIANIQIEIDEIDSRIEIAKQEKSEADGAIKTYMKQLKDDHGLGTLSIAKAWIKEGEADLEEREKDIVSDFSELKDRCGL